MKNAIFLTALIIFSSNLCAVELFRGYGLSSHSSSGTKLFYGSLSLKAGAGTNSSEDKTTIKSRSLFVYSTEASLGVRFFGLITGLDGEFSLWRQSTKPSSVSNSNTQGNLKAVYPFIGFELGPFRVIGKLPTTILFGEYTLGNANSSGQKVNYKDANALGLQLHWSTTPSTFWGIEYQKLTFKTMSTAGVYSTLTSAQKFNMTSTSLIYGFYF